MANRFLTDITVDGKIYYANVFSQTSDLPSASTYHGMFAHVHATGKAYYAHGGNWIELANNSDINAAANNATITLTAGTGLNGGGDFTTDQSANETITVDLADTAVAAGTYGDANNTPQITIDQQGRITSATTVTTAGSGGGGGGGGGGNTTVITTSEDGDGSTVAFTLPNTIADEDNVQIFIDGVYQSKSNYSTSGQVVTFSTAPPTGTGNIELVHYVQLAGAPDIEVDSFNGDGSTVAFTLTTEPVTKNNLQIYIDGVYQAKVNYSTSGTTLTFTTAPETGTGNIEVTHLKIS